MFIVIFLLGLTAIANGSLIKIDGNANAEIMILTGLVMEMVSLTAFFFSNINKVRTLLKQLRE
ncbi:hypothetical protein [Chryseobacterium cheonjiense]|uniref:Uncharacterized protein n=1 Tax=Chryseobacterium cheonjiense TaxID=2728845 RepID=A0A7Y0FHY5_9FLAO|nr:hypothetical protein [Chryseobacterium cheonjiense]NML56771.1 hypothetical protein [Chryseobacterium cheonjiense]